MVVAVAELALQAVADEATAAAAAAGTVVVVADAAAAAAAAAAANEALMRCLIQLLVDSSPLLRRLRAADVRRRCRIQCSQAAICRMANDCLVMQLSQRAHPYFFSQPS